MKAGSILAFLAFGVVVWAFALIGIFSVARAIGPTVTPTPVPLLAINAGPLGTAEIANLPDYPGATRVEFSEGILAGGVVTAIEYTVDSSLEDVRSYYRDVLANGGWTVTNAGWIRGDWVYTVTSSTHRGLVEIERGNGLTEIEVEVIAPSAPRSDLTDR